jgi:hypothetical protein
MKKVGRGRYCVPAAGNPVAPRHERCLKEACEFWRAPTCGPREANPPCPCLQFLADQRSRRHRSRP